MKKKYIEVIQKATKKVVKRMDVSSQSERSIDRIERGMSINMNHAEYFAQQNESETELPVGDFN
jgi:hypothetical protein